jgi:acyl carrier protein
MRADEARTAILNVLKGLELVDDDQAAAPDIEFAGLGIDSMLVVDLCVGLEEQIGREVTIEELIENPTVNQLADHFTKVNA